MIKDKLALLTIGAALLFSSAAVAQTWNMATPWSDGVFHTKNIRAFIEDVDNTTDGKLKIELHPGASLVRMEAVSRSVQDGTVDMGETLIGLMSSISPVFEVESIPFLATSYEDARRLWEVSRETVRAKLEAEGLVLLYSVPWQPQNFYTSNPISSVSDFNGVAFRAYDNSTAELARLLGAHPTQVQSADLAQAFATGMVRAMITSPSTGVDMQAWDFVKHYTVVNAWLPKNAVVVNRDVFERLPDDVKTGLLEAAARAEERGWVMSQELDQSLTETLEKNGMTVDLPNEEFSASMQEIGRTMTENWLARVGQEGQDILDAYRE